MCVNVDVVSNLLVCTEDPPEGVGGLLCRFALRRPPGSAGHHPKTVLREVQDICGKTSQSISQSVNDNLFLHWLYCSHLFWNKSRKGLCCVSITDNLSIYCIFINQLSLSPKLISNSFILHCSINF